MKKRDLRRFSFGLLGFFVALACIFTGCPTDTSDPDPTTYTVTFNVDGGSEVPAQNVEEGKMVAKPTPPTKAGHTFANWYRDADKTTPWNFDTNVIVQDTTIYAKWVLGENVPSFKVTFDANGGAPAPVEQSVVQGEKAQEPAKPTKSGYIFDGWYNGETKWNFSTGVTAAITLKATWIEAVTVTFNTNGGSTIAPLTVAKGSSVYPSEYRPTKSGSVFDGWYTDAAHTTPAGSELEKVTANITLYAKWTSTSELAGYAGVWRSSNGAYLLQEDGTAWRFSSSYVSKSTWSTSQIDGDTVTFNTEKTTFTRYGTTYTKNTTETKTPAAATGALLGVWADGSNRTVELKVDKTAVFASYGDTITLNYCVEANAVYLLAPDTTPNNLMIFSIAIQDGKLSSFSKQASDTSLVGIWKLTENGQDYYWNLKANGSGTFHTLGASASFSFTVTEDKRIDGDSYTVSGNTLTLPDAGWDEETEKSFDIILTKVASVPSGSGADGDSRLHGTWEMTYGSQTITITFNSNGAMEQSYGNTIYSGIWKADGGSFFMYSSSFDPSSRGSAMPYTVSGSTLTLDGLELTKK